MDVTIASLYKSFVYHLCLIDVQCKQSWSTMFNRCILEANMNNLKKKQIKELNYMNSYFILFICINDKSLSLFSIL